MGQKVMIQQFENGLLSFTANGVANDLPIADNVKPEYIRAGLAEVSVQDGIVTYVRMEKKAQQSTQPQVAPVQAPAPVDEAKYPNHQASFYISYAKDLAVAGVIKVEEISDKAKELYKLACEM